MPKALPREDNLVSRVDFGERCRNCVKIVFNEKADRQLIKRGQVHRFHHRAGVDPAVAEKTEHRAARAEHLLRPSDPIGEWHAAANDPVGAERARLPPAQMHRAAPAAAKTFGKAEDFGQSSAENG